MRTHNHSLALISTQFSLSRLCSSPVCIVASLPLSLSCSPSSVRLTRLNQQGRLRAFIEACMGCVRTYLFAYEGVHKHPLNAQGVQSRGNRHPIKSREQRPMAHYDLRGFTPCQPRRRCPPQGHPGQPSIYVRHSVTKMSLLHCIQPPPPPGDPIVPFLSRRTKIWREIPWPPSRRGIADPPRALFKGKGLHGFRRFAFFVR